MRGSRFFAFGADLMTSTRSTLLLNPPGLNIYIWDYYCSKLSRTGYTFPPIDLLHAGVVFKRHGWTTRAIDAIVQGGGGVQETLDLIKNDVRDVVFVLVRCGECGCGHLGFLLDFRGALCRR